MDASALARDLLKWEQGRRALDELEAAIKDSVLQLGKTQTVGNVRASYTKGRKKYDYYEGAGGPGADPDIVSQFQKVTTDWRRVCLDGLGYTPDEIPFEQGDPSVSIKLLE